MFFIFLTMREVFSIFLMKTLIYLMYYLGSGQQTKLMLIGTPPDGPEAARRGTDHKRLVLEGARLPLGPKAPTSGVRQSISEARNHNC